MSPEQARGKPVDKRADIWAFGVVLFEMLAGRRLFEGETVSDTLAAVLRQDIDLAALPADTPQGVRRMIERCLDRDPRTRLRDIGEARIELSELKETPAAQRPVPSGRRAWPLAIAGVLLGALLGLLAGNKLVPEHAAADAPKPPALRRLTELPGPELHPNLSPDGRQLIYASAAGGNLDLYLLRVGGDRAVNLTAGSLADDSQGKFSPDGESIVFRSERDGGGLFTMGATGESVRRVTDFGMDPCWSPDGRKLAFATEAVDDPYSRQILSTLWTVELGTGQKKQLTTAGDAVQPAWSPDGRHIAYWANTGGQRDLWIIAADGGAPVAVTQDRFTDWSPVWSPDGRWLHFSSDRGGSLNLWRIRVGANGLPGGDAQPVTTGTQSMGWAAFSQDGRRLVAMAYDRTNDVAFYGLARLQRGETDPLRRLKLQSSVWCALSPDAEWISCSTRGGHEDLVSLRSDGSEMRRLTDDEHKDRDGRWTPDGRSLVFYSTRSGAWNYWRIRADGSEPRQLTAFYDFNGSTVLSPDGKQVALNADYRGLVVVDVNVSKPVDWNTVHPLPLPEGYPESMFAPQAWSPDGSRIAGVESGASGRSAGYAIYDLREKSLRRLDLTSGNGDSAVAGWLPDSRNLVLRGPAGVAIYDTVAGTTRTILTEPTFLSLRLSRDGEVLMVQKELLDSEIWLLEFE
jgi:Tol biopolymer transport system component